MANRRSRKTKTSRSRHRSRRQRGGWLSRYDFAYAGRDSVNQAAYHVNKVTPKLIDKAFDRARNLAPNLINRTSREQNAIAARRKSSFWNVFNTSSGKYFNIDSEYL